MFIYTGVIVFSWRVSDLSAIYLDNAATTCVSQACADAALRIMTETYFNPSSTHSGGIAARDVLEHSARTVASAIGDVHEEIIFTSGGTEANNLAILGAARAMKRTCRRVITVATEHPSVLESAAYLGKEGYEVIFLTVDRYGRIDLDELEAHLTEDTALVSIMLVNNELGTIHPIQQIRRLLSSKAPRTLLHCDAVQAFGKIPVNVRHLGCDLLTMSGHKIHAPKGVGALYRRKRAKLEPLCFGGSQQNGVRPGTESLPLIAAFAQAVGDSLACMDEARAHYAELNRFAREQLGRIDGLVFNSPEDGLECILNFSTCRIMSETMVNYLSSNGIYVSGGSACKKGRKSHVISALNLDRKASDSAIRISFDRSTTKEDIAELAECVSTAVSTLVNIK